MVNKFFKKNLSAQSSIETLIILAMALFILTALSAIVYDQVEIYRNTQEQKIASIAVSTIAKEVNDIYFLGPGTVKTILVRMPNLIDFNKSVIEGRTLILNVGGSDIFASTKVDVRGVWPNESGAYIFTISAFDDYVSVSIRPVDVNPNQVNEYLIQGSSTDFNIILTNSTLFDYNYSMIIDFPSISSPGVTLTSSFPSLIELSNGESQTINFSLGCLVNSFGSYSGRIIFVPSDLSDSNITIPINLFCSSAQTKLQVYPTTKYFYTATSSSTSDSVLVCNTTSKNFDSTSVSVSGSITPYVLTSFVGQLTANSCTTLPFVINAPIMASNYTGTLLVKSGGYTSGVDLNLVVFATQNTLAFDWSTAYFGSDGKSINDINLTVLTGPFTITHAMVLFTNDIDDANAIGLYFNNQNTFPVNTKAISGDLVNVTDFNLARRKSYDLNLTFDVNIRNDSEKFRIVLKGSDGTYYWSPIFDPTNTIVDNNISHFSNFIQGQEPIYPRDANLIALWRMNDKNSSGWILNSKTGVRDGNLIGGADVNASGLWDKNALNLNGSGSYVKVNSLSSNASNGFTWGVWIKADTLSGSFVLDQRESNVGFQPLYIGSGANYGDIQFYSSNTGSTTYFNTNLQTGLWYHIALVVNSSNSTVSCYINGAFVESKGDTAYNFGLKNLYIGSRHSKASYFDGLIDEVAIWNTALSADEIKEIYSIGSGVHDFNTQADGNGLYLKTIGSTNVSDGNFYSRVFDFNGMVDFNSLSFTKINIGSTFSSVFQKDNNLNSNSSLASSVLKRTDNNAFTATGEMDWNTLANYTFNSTDFNRDMNGLVAYYKLNDKNSGGYVLNSATGVRDGLLNSGADVNVLGLWDTNAGWFNGSTGYVSVPYNLNLAPTNISVSSWFYVLNNSIDQRVISKTESGGYQISFNENNACGASKFCFLVNVGGTYYPTTVPATSIRSNVWTNTVGTYDGETVRLYVNGVLVDSNTSPSGNLTYTQNNPLCIGSEATASACSGSGIYFGGQIDELKIYDRSLSATEILSDYNRFLNAKFVDSNIIDATFTADWNLIKINSDINYNFGKEISSKEKFFDSNLIGLWHLNDKNSQGWVLNSVSGVRDGNLIGGADVNGVGLWDTNAGYFDGVNDYVSAGDIDLIDGVTELTVSTWVKINNVSKDNDIIAKGIHNTNVPLLFWRDDVVGGGSQIGNSKCVSVQVYDGDTSSWTSSPSGSLNDTTWHHVLFTFKANVLSGLKIYVDGVNVNSASTVNVNLIQSSASIVTIGAPTSGGPTNNFSGLMEEVAIWNRALSATEVSDLYRKGISRLDLNVYSCSDSSCTTKTGSQYISDANNNSAMDLNSNVLNSRYLGFDAFFKKAKGFEDYNAGTFYVGSFIKDVNVLYQNNLMSLFGRVSVNGLTWLDWNTLSDASLQSLNIPDGNFFQYKAVLSSASNASSPVLRDLNVTYRRIDN